MPLSRDEFNRRMSEVLTFLGDLLRHPERIDGLAAVVHVPSSIVVPNETQLVSQDPHIELHEIPEGFFWGSIVLHSYTVVGNTFVETRKPPTGVSLAEAQGHVENLRVTMETPRIYGNTLSLVGG
jgi:hypothetical protein